MGLRRHARWARSAWLGEGGGLGGGPAQGAARATLRLSLQNANFAPISRQNANFVPISLHFPACHANQIPGPLPRRGVGWGLADRVFIFCGPASGSSAGPRPVGGASGRLRTRIGVRCRLAGHGVPAGRMATASFPVTACRSRLAGHGVAVTAC